MNDDEIINLFLKRDENGIIELSTKYHPYCYKIAWNLLANREDAEECLNDTWFSVHWLRYLVSQDQESSKQGREKNTGRCNVV